MSGLIYRLIVLCRKNIVLSSLAVLGIELIGMLARLSLSYGNLAKITEDSKESAESALFVMCAYSPLALLIISNLLVCDTLVTDMKKRWSSYAHCLPVSTVRYTGGYYLVYLMITAAAFLITTVTTAVSCAAFDKSFSFSNVKIILIAITIGNLFTVIAHLSNQITHSRILCFILLMVIGYGLPLIYSTLEMNYVNKHTAFPSIEASMIYGGFIKGILYYTIDFIAPVLPVMIPAVLFIGWQLSSKIMERREK